MRRFVPTVVAVLAIVLSVPAALALPPENDAWSERHSEHFTFLTDANEKQVTALAAYFETLRGAFGVLVPGVELRSAPTDIYLFRDRAALAPYLMVRAGMDPKTASGYYRSAEYVKLFALSATDPVEHSEDALRAYLADIVRGTFSTAPPWLESGLAQVYGNLAVVGERLEIGRPIPAYVLLLRKSTPIPFKELFTMAKPAENTEIVGAPSVFGAESWTLVHYLLIGEPAMRPKTLRFLEALSKGAPPQAAFDEAFGATAAGELDAALKEYVARPKFAFYALPVSSIRIASLGAPEPLSRRDVLYRLGWLLANIDVSNAPQAEAHFRAALTLDAAHGPSVAGLGWIRSRAKQFDEAVPLFEQALTLGADDPLTLTLAGRNLLAQYGATRSTFEAPKTLPENVARARVLLEKAVAACARCGEAHAALGATYLYDPAASAPGIAEIETALTLTPPRADLLLNLVSLYARQGDRTRAQAVIDGPVMALGDASATLSARERLAFADLAAINAKLAAGELDAALDMLKGARDGAPTPRLKAQFESEIARIEPVAIKNRQVAKFNEAVALANKGNWKDAGAICDALLAEALDDQLRPRVEDLQKKAKSAAVPRKK